MFEAPFDEGGFFTGFFMMNEGHFYYIDDQYYVDFPDKYLMKNKEEIAGKRHDRSCFYAFLDTNTGLYWMIPISSQVSKFKSIYNGKVAKYKSCDTIVFGEVLGQERAFFDSKYVSGNRKIH